MASFFDRYNPSILAIPAYWLLSAVPHVLAVSAARQGSFSNWDNSNPRSSDLKAKLKARLPAETFARYERLEACHANGLENLPLFATAVILGNMAGLKKDSMTTFVASFLVIRVAYTAAYANIRTQGPSAIRSVLYNVGAFLCLKTIVQAAKALGGART